MTSTTQAGQNADVVIVGAGVAGLVAARELLAAGLRVIVLEKGRGVGGRMATRRLGAAVCDHGAQFFTVRGRAFGTLVREAHDAGAVAEWCDGFTRATANGGGMLPPGDGHPRWRGTSGMTGLPKHIATAFDPARGEVRAGVKVASIGIAAARVTVGIDDGSMLRAAAAIVSSPVPQSLELMVAGGMVPDAIDPAALRLLAGIDYDPCFALMLVLDRPSLVPSPGGIQFEAEGPANGPIAWLADNQQKGISSVPSLTVHATAAFSREHFDAPADDVAEKLLEAAAAWIDGPVSTAVIERSLQRWKFAQPKTPVADPLVVACTQPPIVCCGDAFGTAKVEGAASSGLAAARWAVRVLAGET
ncbi:MAG: FAD-dependent oxidoreductase [Planctomycetota bacterium]|nr:FAD-dependent oxidoreductase [Planctomycetota bacterium]